MYRAAERRIQVIQELRKNGTNIKSFGSSSVNLVTVIRRSL